MLEPLSICLLPCMSYYKRDLSTCCHTMLEALPVNLPAVMHVMLEARPVNLLPCCHVIFFVCFCHWWKKAGHINTWSIYVILNKIQLRCHFCINVTKSKCHLSLEVIAWTFYVLLRYLLIWLIQIVLFHKIYYIFLYYFRLLPWYVKFILNLMMQFKLGNSLDALFYKDIIDGVVVRTQTKILFCILWKVIVSLFVCLNLSINYWTRNCKLNIDISVYFTIHNPLLYSEGWTIKWGAYFMFKIIRLLKKHSNDSLSLSQTR